MCRVYVSMMWMDLQGQVFTDVVEEMVKTEANFDQRSYLKTHTMTSVTRALCVGYINDVGGPIRTSIHECGGRNGKDRSQFRPTFILERAHNDISYKSIVCRVYQ